MTYEEQLKIEEQNRQILESLDGEALIEFYKTHNRKEAREKFGIRTDKQLVKALTKFGYDFSFQKGLNKGKPSTRSHESYVAGGAKSSATQKQHWEEKSNEEKEAWSKMQAEAHSNEAFKQKIRQINLNYWANLTAEQKAEISQRKSEANKTAWVERGDEIIAQSKQTCLEKYGVDNFAKTDKYQQIISSEENLQQRAQRNYETKRQNNSFSVSKPEDVYYNYLCNKYGKANVYTQYRDDRYPFNCDFYIKPLDLFIELNLTWSHGGHRFDRNNADDIAKLTKWQQKAESSDYYKNAIDVWTVRDPLKFATAEQNNLNYIAYYNEEEMYVD